MHNTEEISSRPETQMGIGICWNWAQIQEEFREFEAVIKRRKSPTRTINKHQIQNQPIQLKELWILKWGFENWVKNNPVEKSPLKTPKIASLKVEILCNPEFLLCVGSEIQCLFGLKLRFQGFVHGYAVDNAWGVRLSLLFCCLLPSSVE